MDKYIKRYIKTIIVFFFVLLFTFIELIPFITITAIIYHFSNFSLLNLIITIINSTIFIFGYICIARKIGNVPVEEEVKYIRMIPFISLALSAYTLIIIIALLTLALITICACNIINIPFDNSFIIITVLIISYIVLLVFLIKEIFEKIKNREWVEELKNKEKWRIE